MNNKKGRPTEYSNEELKEILSQYAIQNTGKVTYLGLEKETGIKRHVWSRRMKKEIDRLNMRVSNINADNFEQINLPNVRDIVEKNWNNKENLIEDLLSLNNYINNLWDKAIQQEKSAIEIQKLNDLIDSLKLENEYLKQERNHLREELDKNIVSENYVNPEQTKRKSIQSLREENANWKEQFPSLFD